MSGTSMTWEPSITWQVCLGSVSVIRKPIPPVFLYGLSAVPFPEEPATLCIQGGLLHKPDDE